MILISLFINFFIFLILTFLVIYLPGFLFLSGVYKTLESSERIALSLSIGIVFLTLLGLTLGLTNIRFLLFPILFSFGLMSLFKLKKSVFSPWILFKKDIILLSLILLGIIVQGFISFPSGFRYHDGLLFWSSQGFDGFWHISIMEEIKREFPPQIPVFSGEKLVNYHYLSDVLMGEFARIFPFFSSLDLYFRFFPVMFSFLMGISTFSFVQRWKSKKVAYWALFFTYFTGSFGYIVTFLRNGQIFGGETAFWVSQLNTVVANPPHAVAISLLLAFLLSFLIFLQRRENQWLFLSIICGLMVAGFKVSGGVVLLTGLAAAALIEFLFNKKKSVLFILISLGVSNFTTIKLMTRGVEQYLIFEPWWFIRTMVVVKLGFIEWEHRRQHYIAKGTFTSFLRMLSLEAVSFMIFLVGNIGMRVLGFLAIFKIIFLRRFQILRNPFEVSIFVMMITGFLVPLFFLQKGIVYNIIQFMQYFLLFIGFYAAISCAKIIELLKNNFIKYTFIIILVMFSIPTVIGNLVEFYGSGTTPLAVVSNDELEALNYLKNHSNKNDVVLSPAFNKYLKDGYHSQPFPIYVWYSTGYISGLAGRRTYLSSEDMAIQTGFNVDKRLAEVNKFFDQGDIGLNKNFLRETNISFIYIPKVQLSTNFKTNNNDKIFENAEVVIYKVKN